MRDTIDISTKDANYADSELKLGTVSAAKVDEYFGSLTSAADRFMTLEGEKQGLPAREIVKIVLVYDRKAE